MKDETLSGIITSELLFLYKMCWQGLVKNSGGNLVLD